MEDTGNHFNNIGINSDLDMPRIRHLMKIGLAAGIMVLIGGYAAGLWGIGCHSIRHPGGFCKISGCIRREDIMVGSFGTDRNPIGVPLLFCGLPADSPGKRKICAYIPHGNSWLSGLWRLRGSCALLRGGLFYEENV